MLAEECHELLMGGAVGVVLYVVSNIAKISFERMARAIVPFLIPLLVVLAASTLWPPLTTWLPGLVIGR